MTTFQRQSAHRKAFTLVELLMVISIIAILATLSIAVIRGAENDARAARTETIVRNIRKVIERRMETFETRTLPFSFRSIGLVNSIPDSYRIKQQVRLTFLAESFRSEFPVSNAVLTNYPSTSSQTSTDPDSGAFIQAMANRLSLRPSSFVRKLQRHFVRGNNGTNEDAECLYAILYNSWDGHYRGTHFLTPTEIGDTDGDGNKEVLDAWGDPLIFSVSVPDGAGGFRAVDPALPTELNDYLIEINSQRSGQL